MSEVKTVLEDDIIISYFLVYPLSLVTFLEVFLVEVTQESQRRYLINIHTCYTTGPLALVTEYYELVILNGCNPQEGTIYLLGQSCFIEGFESFLGQRSITIFWEFLPITRVSLRVRERCV